MNDHHPYSFDCGLYGCASCRRITRRKRQRARSSDVVPILLGATVAAFFPGFSGWHFVVALVVWLISAGILKTQFRKADMRDDPESYKVFTGKEQQI